MSDETSIVTKKAEYDLQLQEFETALLGYLSTKGLPVNDILVDVSERATVFRNLDPILDKISNDQLSDSIYISKFLAATSSGLFDAALNYLWDQTMLELKKRVAHYDISYFYDIAIKNPEKRKTLATVEDLDKLQDSELIRGAREIELISEMGLKHLDFIRFMRNWASAAHPNQNQLSGLQLISWLETCVKEVISLPISSTGVEIKKLLGNVRNKTISAQEAKEIATFFLNLSQDQANSLASGFWGIYTQVSSSQESKQNIIHLIPHLWDQVDEAHKEQFGLKYGKFVANHLQEEKNLARELLELVNGIEYIPNDLRVNEIQTTIDNLLNAGRGYNNFHTEPVFARELLKLVPAPSNIPKQIEKNFIFALVELFITNGSGVAWNAEVIYQSFITKLTQNQGILALLSFSREYISMRLQHSLCQKKFKEMINLIKPKITYPIVTELITELEQFRGTLDMLKQDTRIREKVRHILTKLNFN
jgi:hypothetical protein